MKRISITIVLVIFLLLGVALFFIYRNYTNQFTYAHSKTMADWSSFADYVGGMGNMLISLASLLIIGFLTILLGRDKNDYYHELRNQAYDQLITYVPKLMVSTSMAELALTKLTRETKRISGELDKVVNDPEKLRVANLQDFENRKTQVIFEFTREINSEIMVFHEYRFYLKNFYPRYGRLFKDDKFGDKFSELLISAKKMTDDLQEYRNVLIGNSEKSIDDIPYEESAERHMAQLTGFINKLHKEL